MSLSVSRASGQANHKNKLGETEVSEQADGKLKQRQQERRVQSLLLTASFPPLSAHITFVCLVDCQSRELLASLTIKRETASSLMFCLQVCL